MDTNEEKTDHSGHRERLRKKVYETKLNNFSESQVLEYLLSFVIARKDTAPIANELLMRFGNLKNIFHADIEDLTQVKNIGNHTAHFLRFLPLVFGYYNNKFECQERQLLNSPQKIADYARPYFRNLDCEQLMIIILDKKSNSITQTVLSMGDRESVNVKSNKIFTMLDMHNAKHFVIIHNHVGETCKPSREDNESTRKLTFSSLSNNVRMYDHVIIGCDGFYSYRMTGVLDMFEHEIEKILNISANI